MINSPIILALIAFSLLACVFAFMRGGAAERAGAAVILTNLIMSLGNEYLLGNSVVALAIDGLTAMALLVLALRYASLWIGAVMLLYALQFGLHAFYLVADRKRDLLHVVINNVDFFSVSLCLMLGTFVAHRRAMRSDRAAPA